MSNQVRVIISDMQGVVLDQLTITGNPFDDRFNTVNKLSQQVASQIEAGNFLEVE